MARMLKVHEDRYPHAFAFLSRELPEVSKQAAVWKAFLDNSKLTVEEGRSAIGFVDTPPLIFVSELGPAILGQFDPQVPGRIEITAEALEKFGSAVGPDAGNFLLAKVLHEMCHWACFRKGIADDDQSGEAFERAAYQKELLPWWVNANADAIENAGVFKDPAVRATELQKLAAASGRAPGRMDDPDHAVFAGKDVSEAMRRGYRNNNPGNIRVSSSMWRGLADPEDQTGFQRREENFCVFREPEWGLRAIAFLLRKYQADYSLDTPRKIISRWAPASDNNDVASYAEALAKALGIGPDTRVDTGDAKTLTTMLKAIARHENGERPPYAEMQYATALLL